MNSAFFNVARGVEENNISNLVTGAGVSNHIAFWNSSSGLGYVDITGRGTVFVTVTNSLITISGSGSNLDTSTFATVANLFTTGSNLYNMITGLSGVMNSNPGNVNIPNLITGAGTENKLALWVGNTGLGQTQLTGAGNVTVWFSPNLITISGNTGAYSTFASSANLELTGSNLQTQINTLTTNLTNTGVNLQNSFNLLSGNLISTGANLQNAINTVSGLAINQLTGISVTGSNSLIGKVNFTGMGSVSTILSGQTVIVSGSSAGTVQSVSAFSGGLVIALCSAYTPTGLGPDMAQIPIPFNPLNGTGVITFNVRRINLRVAISGGTPSCDVEKSTGIGPFSANYVGSLNMENNAYETYTLTGLGTVQSNNKLRFNVTNLGSAQYWTVTTELGTD